MDSYFFVPGNKLEKLNKIQTLGVDHIIIDLEDAVKHSEIPSITKSLEEGFERFADCYIRVPLVNDLLEIDTALLKHLQGIGFYKFVFPKLNNSQEFREVIADVQSDTLKIILLVESPSLLYQCNELLSEFKDIFVGVGLGSHDFMSVVGGKHILANLEFARQHILYIARSHDLFAIDIASMELENESDILFEIQDGFDKGYDAKFIIHPWQLRLLQNIQFYNEEEYEWAIKIEKLVNKVGVLNEFNAVRVDGQVIEKPHWNRVQKILKFHKRYDTK